MPREASWEAESKQQPWKVASLPDTIWKGQAGLQNDLEIFLHSRPHLLEYALCQNGNHFWESLPAADYCKQYLTMWDPVRQQFCRGGPELVGTAGQRRMAFHSKNGWGSLIKGCGPTRAGWFSALGAPEELKMQISRHHPQLAQFTWSGLDPKRCLDCLVAQVIRICSSLGWEQLFWVKNPSTWRW